MYSKGNIQNQEGPVAEYAHKVMAPVFLTNKANNMSYVSGLNQSYASQVGAEKRDLEYNLPKIMRN